MAIRLNNPLTFPGGMPFQNGAHPMALGARLAAVPVQGGKWLDLLTAKTSSQVGAGIVTQLSGIGPVIKTGTASGVYSNFANSFADGTPNAITIAAIIIPTGTAAYSTVFNTANHTQGGGGVGIITDNTGQVQFIDHSGTIGSSGLPVLVVGQPYFIAVSMDPNLNGGVNIIQANLQTGQVWTFSTSGTSAGAVGTASFVIGGDTVQASQHTMAAVAYSANGPFMSLTMLKQWAKAPWDYWYPGTLADAILTSSHTQPPSGPVTIHNPGLVPHQAVTLRGNRYSFPGGSPALNPSFMGPTIPAMAVVGLSNGGMIDLTSGAAGVKTGTITGTLDSQIGPASVINTSASYYTFSNKPAGSITASGTGGGVTFACICKFITISGNYNGLFGNSSTNPSGSFNVYLLNGQFMIDQGGIQTIVSPGPTLVAGVPYFIALTIFNAYVQGVVVDLSTGKTQAIPATALFNGILNTNGSYRVGSTPINNAYPILANVAAMMYSLQPITPAQLTAWAKAPWDYWYPPAMQSILSIIKVTSVQYLQSLGWTTTSAITPLKAVSPTESWTTTSSVTPIKSAGKLLSWTTTSALSTVRSAIRACSVALTTTSAVAVAYVKAAVGAVSITTTSTVSALKSASKGLSWTTSSALSAVKAVAKGLSWTTSSAVTVSHGTIVEVLLLTTSSAVTVLKSVGKVSRWTTSSAVAALTHFATGVVVSITTISTLALTASRATIQAVSFTTHGALSVGKTANKLMKWTTHGTLKAGKYVSHSFKFVTKSKLTAIKQALKNINIASFSAVNVNDFSGVHRALITITTTSSLAIQRTINKIVKWSTHTRLLRIFKKVFSTQPISTVGAISLTAFMGHTYAQLVSIATTGALSAIKLVKKKFGLAGGPFIHTHGTLKVAKAINKPIPIATTSHGHGAIIKAISITRAIRTLSSVIPGALKASVVNILITTTSTVSFFPGYIIGLTIYFTTTSAVSVSTTFYLVGKATFELVGRAYGMVLSSRVARMITAGRRNQLELDNEH